MCNFRANTFPEIKNSKSIQFQFHPHQEDQVEDQYNHHNQHRETFEQSPRNHHEAHMCQSSHNLLDLMNTS